MPVLAAGIALGAFLLFQVQPVLGRYLLPSFGGGPAVWTVCLLFFQTLLLVGYAWAHLLNRLPARRAVTLHLTVAALATLAIPIFPELSGADPASPVRSILYVLLASAGLPYFLLATTGPLLQSWWASAYPGASPYRLYALSNTGSLAGLLSYPFLVEPHLGRDRQVMVWSVLFLAYLGLLVAAASIYRRASSDGGAGDRRPAPVGGRPAAPRGRTAAAGGEVAGVRPSRALGWMLYAATGSMLLMAFSNQLTREVAPVPFLWVLPLAAYLLSFILCFDGSRWYRPATYSVLLGASLVAVGLTAERALALPFWVQLATCTVALFVGCMCCHGELARRRPDPTHLTLFYLMIAAGGALGSAFVTFVAPRVFSGYWELNVALVAAAIGVLYDHRAWTASRPAEVLGAALVAAVVTHLGLFAIHLQQVRTDTVHVARGFYGIVRVTLREGDRPELRLFHGNTNHGSQFLAPADRGRTTTYYGPRSGVAVAIREHPARALRPIEVGVIGLGAGTLAAYGRPGDRFRFWEIDPEVAIVARERFRYLEDSPARVDVVLGDGRLEIARELTAEGGDRYDLLAIDAFSSDAVPTHLLTVEAAELYWRLLRADGLLAFHVSNRFVELEPVVIALAARTGAAALRFDVDGSEEEGTSDSTWLVLARANPEFLGAAAVRDGGRSLDGAGAGAGVVWTDDFASVWPLLDLGF